MILMRRLIDWGGDVEAFLIGCVLCSNDFRTLVISIRV